MAGAKADLLLSFLFPLSFPFPPNAILSSYPASFDRTHLTHGAGRGEARRGEAGVLIGGIREKGRKGDWTRSRGLWRNNAVDLVGYTIHNEGRGRSDEDEVTSSG